MTAVHVDTIAHLDFDPVLGCDVPDCDGLAVLVQRPTEHYGHKNPTHSPRPLLLCAGCWGMRAEASRIAGPMTCCCGAANHMIPLYIEIERWL